MQFIPVPNVAQVELVYTFYSQYCENVMHFSGANVSDEVVLTGLANDALLQWSSTWRASQNNNLTLVRIKVTSLEAQNAPGIEVPVTTSNTGSLTGAALPNNCAICVSLKTGLRGRSYRGRVYIPGIDEGSVTGNTVNTNVLNAFTASYDYWDYLDVSGEPYALGVVSRYHNGIARTQGVFTQVTDFVVNPTIASQRRRLPGRGM